ncbi:hypothetical protein WJX72_000362 [[Myrmecia] bisecta]|uniref:Uncharacterized protein n=1 Tax=[Myrmecia] bisecta TaxID=41462 RepID=A0AAW1PZI7_9CHLO
MAVRLKPLLLPFYGMWYFCWHPTLAKHVLDFVIHALFSQLVIALLLAVSTFRFQSHLVSKITGVGFHNSVVTSILLLAEALLPLYFFMENINRKVSQQLFTATLDMEGIQVSQLSSAEKLEVQLQHAADNSAKRERKQEQQQSTSNSDASIGKATSEANSKQLVERSTSLTTRTFNFLWSCAVYLFQSNAVESRAKRYMRTFWLSPLLAIFPLGTMFVSWLNGFSTAQVLLKPYWEQKGLSSQREREEVMGRNKQDFQLFGATAALLDMIPILNWLFGFSSTIGAALFAADLERNKTLSATHEE